MGAHDSQYNASVAEWTLPDPGNAGAITNTQTGTVPLVTAAAETRTLAAPLKNGLELTLVMKTDGGDCVVTVASAYDEAGGTTLTFADPGQYVTLRSVHVAASTYAWRVVSYDGVTGPTTTISSLNLGGTAVTSSAAELNILDGVLATAAEINRNTDMSTRLVPCTASTLAVTVADHDGKIIELDRAAGIAVTLPSLATSTGAVFRFRVKTTFTGAATIKSVASGDIMVGHALMGNDSNNTVVDFQSVAADTNDTIDLLGTSNSTGGIEGQEIEIIGGTGRWYVSIRGDAAGTEATPFANTVS